MLSDDITKGLIAHRITSLSTADVSNLKSPLFWGQGTKAAAMTASVCLVISTANLPDLESQTLAVIS